MDKRPCDGVDRTASPPPGKSDAADEAVGVSKTAFDVYSAVGGGGGSGFAARPKPGFLITRKNGSDTYRARRSVICRAEMTGCIASDSIGAEKSGSGSANFESAIVYSPSC